jgi:hypothetical protein
MQDYLPEYSLVLGPALEFALKGEHSAGLVPHRDLPLEANL